MAVTFFIHFHFSGSVHLDTHRSRSVILAVLFFISLYKYFSLPKFLWWIFTLFPFFLPLQTKLQWPATLQISLIVYSSSFLFLVFALVVWFCPKYLIWILPFGSLLWYSQSSFEGEGGVRKTLHNLERQFSFTKVRGSEIFFSSGFFFGLW